MCRRSRKPGRETAQETKPANTLISDFWYPQTVKNDFLLFNPLRL